MGTYFSRREEIFLSVKKENWIRERVGMVDGAMFWIILAVQVIQVFNQDLIWMAGYSSDQIFSLKKDFNSFFIISLFAKKKE